VEDETRRCNKNLTTETGVEMTPLIWEVDEAAGHIYHFYSAILKRGDFGFDEYEEFPESPACYFFQRHRVLGVCPAAVLSRPPTPTLSPAPLTGNRPPVYNYIR